MSDPVVSVDKYRKDIEKASKETWDKIEEALGYIKRQEDGPFTMTVAIREIGEKLDRLETEVSILCAGYQEVEVMTRLLRSQRREAFKARDRMRRVIRAMRDKQDTDDYAV